jgi:hypothetical protein
MRKSDLADMAVRVDGDSLLIKLAGVVTFGTMRSLRRTTFRWAMRHEVARVLIDLSSAVLFMGAAEWPVLTEDSASRNALRITTGLLVAEPYADAAWDHCERLSDYGRICLAFTDRCAAYHWAGLAPGLLVAPPAAAAYAAETPPHMP